MCGIPASIQLSPASQDSNLKEKCGMPMTAQTINLKDGDTIALQYLGAAVILQWDNLPKPIQDMLSQQASSVGGLPMLTSLHEQIKLLLRRERG